MRDKLGVLETHFFLTSSIGWTKPVRGEAARLFQGPSVLLSVVPDPGGP